MKRFYSHSGFSLLDLLIAMGILGIFLVALGSLLTTTNKTYSTQSDLIDVQDRIRGTMELLVRTLRNGVASTVTITGTSPNQALSFKMMEDVGRSTGSNNSTALTDTTKTWTANQWQDYYVQVSSGTGIGQDWKQIISNTDNQLTISGSSPWAPVPDATSEYTIASANSFARSGNTLQYTKNGITADLASDITGVSVSLPDTTRVDLVLSAQTTNIRQDTGSIGSVTLQSKATLKN